MCDRSDDPIQMGVVSPTKLRMKLLLGSHGGGRSQVAAGVAVDATGAVYVTGTTVSTDLPVVGAIEPARRGAKDGFVTKLAPGASSVPAA